MAGYNGKSMSNNAVAAYENGEMPRSKWTKKAIIAAIDEHLNLYDRTIDGLEKMTKAQLFDTFIEYSSWHHTNMFYAETDFFQLDEEAVDEASRAKTEDELKAEEAAKRAKEQARREACEARCAKEDAFEAEYGFAHNSYAAVLEFKPEMLINTRISKKGNKIYDFKLVMFYGERVVPINENMLAKSTCPCFSALED